MLSSTVSDHSDVWRARVMRVTGISVVVALALLLACDSFAATRRSGASTRGIVGTYQVVAHGTAGPAKGVTSDVTFRITALDHATRKLRGTAMEQVNGSWSFFAITGTVSGAAIQFRLVNSKLGYVAHLRGQLRADGNATGTISDSNGSKGVWTMTRLWVVVVKTGWGREAAGPDASFDSFGVRVMNQSNREALGVRITVNQWLRGQGLATEEFKIAAIPAGRTFVVADSHANLRRIRVTKMIATVHVTHLIRHVGRDRLLRVSNVRLERKNDLVSAKITNRYPFAINLQQANAYAVLYNKAGRIIGGGNALSLFQGPVGHGRKTLGPGGHVQIAISVAAQMSQVVGVQVSATP